MKSLMSLVYTITEKKEITDRCNIHTKKNLETTSGVRSEKLQAGANQLAKPIKKFLILHSNECIYQRESSLTAIFI